jgi:2-polyprenyl-6-methoxyphenol hydroxylase-like FAD-dependent oxidoreductase
LRTAFAEFHPQVRQVLAACPAVHKWVLVDRDPLPRWSEGNVTLLGDACHPMTPYMAQGDAMAIEDAAVLSRCLENVDRAGVADAFRRFEATRKPRTSRVQLASRTNTGSGIRPIRSGFMLRRLDRAAGRSRPGRGGERRRRSAAVVNRGSLAKMMPVGGNYHGSQVLCGLAQ